MQRRMGPVVLIERSRSEWPKYLCRDHVLCSLYEVLILYEVPILYIESGVRGEKRIIKTVRSTP